MFDGMKDQPGAKDIRTTTNRRVAYNIEELDNDEDGGSDAGQREGVIEGLGESKSSLLFRTSGY